MRKEYRWGLFVNKENKKPIIMVELDFIAEFICKNGNKWELAYSFMNPEQLDFISYFGEWREAKKGFRLTTKDKDVFIDFTKKDYEQVKRIILDRDKRLKDWDKK